MCYETLNFYLFFWSWIEAFDNLPKFVFICVRVYSGEVQYFLWSFFDIL